MFCTGGIRCEIASSFFINEGIEGVCQLKGGILNYLTKINLADQLWKGECFVFDERVSVNRRLKKGRVSTVLWLQKTHFSSRYRI